MAFKLPKRYTEKANDSFKTKRNLYLFGKALNNTWDTVGLEDFRQFSIDQDLVKVYVTIYWQYEPTYLIAGERRIDEIQKDIARKETELKPIWSNSGRITSARSFTKDFLRSNLRYSQMPGIANIVELRSNRFMSWPICKSSTKRTTGDGHLKLIARTPILNIRSTTA